MDGRLSVSAGFQRRSILNFAIRWGVVTGGYATLSVPSVDLIGGQPAYHILSEAHSTGMVETFFKVRDRNEAWMDTDLSAAPCVVPKRPLKVPAST